MLVWKRIVSLTRPTDAVEVVKPEVKQSMYMSNWYSNDIRKQRLQKGVHDEACPHPCYRALSHNLYKFSYAYSAQVIRPRV